MGHSCAWPGAAPLAGELGEIAAVADKAALARLLGGSLRADVDPLNNTNFYTGRLFGLWVSPDFDDPNRNSPYLLQGGLGMPDRENYLSTDAKTAALQSAYRTHIAAVLKLARIPDAAAKAARIYDLERKIAEVHVSRTDSLDVQKANNRWRLPDFAEKAPGLDWRGYFEAAGLGGQPAIMVWHPTAITGIAALAASEPFEVWKEYLTFRAIDRASPLLPKAFVDERFAFYGKALTGAPQQRDR